MTFRRIERALDEGTGSCVLRSTLARVVMAESLRFYDGTRYELNGYVIMPNHVHVLMKPTEPKLWPLEDILHSWMRYTAVEFNRMTRREGAFWQEESVDRIVRDEEHLYRCVQYIGDNPKQAGLSGSDYVLWMRDDWKSCGWDFRREIAHVNARVGNPCYEGEPAQ